MKKIIFITLLLYVFQCGSAQEITLKLKSGELDLVVNKPLERAENIKYYFMTFIAIPSIEE
jgi:hypothetical protein